ncbi:hypothetical protein Tco_1537817, partial [Tanacetum coccineum]
MDDKIEGLGNGRDFYSGDAHRGYLGTPPIRYEESSGHDPSTTPPPDYPFDKTIFAELDNSLWIISRPLISESDPEKPNDTNHDSAAIKKLVVDSVAAALEAQATTMANTENTNRNTLQRETPVARKCSYKEFMSCQPFNFK